MASVRVLWTSATVHAAGQIRIQGEETEVHDHEVKWLVENGYCTLVTPVKSETATVISEPTPNPKPKAEKG